MKKIGIQAVIHGKVQGVFFRDSARREALKLEITGWISNNADGTVSLHAFGSEENIKRFITWLHQGPIQARVDRVDYSEIPFESIVNFTIVR